MTDSSLNPPLIRIVDDEAIVREALSFLLACKGWQSISYASAEAFLADARPGVPGCLLLDIRMPGMSGLELQQRMKAASLDIPVIFVTGHADVETAVMTLKAGALDFLLKPVDGEKLDEAIRSAVGLSLERLRGQPAKDALERTLEEMSPREKEVLARLREGLTNRDIALQLDISVDRVEQLVKALLTKLGAANRAEAVSLAYRKHLLPT